MNFPLTYILAGIITENDPHGFMVTVVSLLVIFLTLLILSLAYLLIGKAVRKCEKSQNIIGEKPQEGYPHMDRTHVRKLSLSMKTEYLTRELYYQQDEDRCGKATSGTMRSPLPGTILSINVKVGDKVRKGQEVAVLESMKMENSIESEFNGTVTAIHVTEGKSVQEGNNLITIG